MRTNFSQMEAALRQRGVRRVSLCFAPGTGTLSKSDRVAGVKAFLGTYLDGRFVQTQLGDLPAASTAG